MNRNMFFILFVFLMAACLEDKGQGKPDKIKLLTGGNSKGWIMYEHNFSAEDNTVFVQTPPYVFTHWYGADYLLINSNFTFKVGYKQNATLVDFAEQWSLSGEGDSLKLESSVFGIEKLTNDELFIRQKVPSTLEKTLPYFEYRFRKQGN